jgi:hypothetical protein
LIVSVASGAAFLIVAREHPPHGLRMTRDVVVDGARRL